MRKEILLISFILFGASLFAHPIKMSTGKLTLQSNEKTAKLLINFFMDDFEAEMRKKYPQPPFVYKQPSDEMKLSIQDYIRKNVSVVVQTDEAEISLSKISVIEDNVCQVQLNLDFKKPLKCQEIKVKNALLFDSFEKQSNVVHLIVDDQSHQILQFYPNKRVVIVKR